MQCKGEIKCEKCQESDKSTEANVNETIKCVYFTGNYRADRRNCHELERQENIKQIMVT